MKDHRGAIDGGEKLLAAPAEHLRRAELAEADGGDINSPCREPVEIARDGTNVVVFGQDPGVRPVQMHRIHATQLRAYPMRGTSVAGDSPRRTRSWQTRATVVTDVKADHAP